MGKGVRSVTTAATTPVVAVKSVFSNPQTVGEWVVFTVERLLAQQDAIDPSRTTPQWLTLWASYFTSYRDPTQNLREALATRQANVAKVKSFTRGNFTRLDYLLLQLYSNRTDARRNISPYPLEFEDVKGRTAMLATPVLVTNGWYRGNCIPLATLGDWADLYWSGLSLVWSLQITGMDTVRVNTEAEKLFVPTSLAANAAVGTPSKEAVRQARLAVFQAHTDPTSPLWGGPALLPQDDAGSYTALQREERRVEANLTLTKLLTKTLETI